MQGDDFVSNTLFANPLEGRLEAPNREVSCTRIQETSHASRGSVIAVSAHCPVSARLSLGSAPPGVAGPLLPGASDAWCFRCLLLLPAAAASLRCQLLPASTWCFRGLLPPLLLPGVPGGGTGD
jgi:hypothetical protein